VQPHRITACVVPIFALLCGCDDLREFKTDANEVFRGEVAGSDSNGTGDSFIRKGFASHTLLELRFNPNAGGLVILDESDPPSRRKLVPGMIHTYVCADGAATCAESDRTLGPFQHARLIPIEGLAHDTLSQYTFPGGGRLHNYMFGVRFTSSTATAEVSRDAMIFVSLMESGQVELRAIAPSVVAADETEQLPALFGMFILNRQALR
jgi:hypothetical protein